MRHVTITVLILSVCTFRVLVSLVDRFNKFYTSLAPPAPAHRGAKLRDHWLLGRLARDMPPKIRLTFDVNFNGIEVKCKVQGANLITVGIEGTGPYGRLTAKRNGGETDEAAALRKLHAVQKQRTETAAGGADADAADVPSAAGAAEGSEPSSSANVTGANELGQAEAVPDLFGNVADTMADLESAGGEGGRRRSSRQRAAPSLLNPTAELPPGELFRLEGGRATGKRRALADECECKRPKCVATREENTQLRQKLEAETSRRAVLAVSVRAVERVLCV